MLSPARIAVLIAVLAALWMASGLVLRPDAPEDPAPEAAPAPRVRVLDSTARPLSPEIIITGQTRAARRVWVRAEVEGQVTALPADEGAAVEAGAPLAQIEERDRAARVSEAQGRVRQREIQHKAARDLARSGFSSKVRLAEAAADLETARAELAAARVALDKTAIAAPFAGIVQARAVELGDYVTPGEPLFEIVALDPLVVEGFASERQLPALRLGQAAEARLLDGRALAGTLTFIAPAAGQAARTFRLEVTADNPEASIPAGLTATLAFPGPEVAAHALTPAALTLSDAGVLGVRIVDAGGIVGFAPVEIVRDGADAVWVTGPPERARIIVTGQEFVTAGQAVEAMAQ